VNYDNADRWKVSEGCGFAAAQCGQALPDRGELLRSGRRGSASPLEGGQRFPESRRLSALCCGKAAKTNISRAKIRISSYN